MEEINNFQQEPDESLFRAWERFKELLMKCPQHYLTDMHGGGGRGGGGGEKEVILFYNGLDVPTRQILDSKGAIPSKTAQLDLKIAIQEWLNTHLEMTQKHLPRTKRPHFTKDCPQKEEGKILKEAYYTQFSVHYQPGGQYRATRPRFYQRNNGNSSHTKPRSYPIKTLEIQIRQNGASLLQERGLEACQALRKQTLETKLNRSQLLKLISLRYAVSGMSHTPYRAHNTEAYFLKQSLFQDDCKTSAVMIGERHTMDEDEGKSHDGTLIDIPVFVGSFSIISSFTIIDDDDMTKDVVLGMKFYKKYASCQRIMKRFALGNNCERIMEDE
ncbi:hypothetical protein Tco_0615234 [Tanacetum coccineum]